MTIRIVPLAGESLGVRSMATFVETDDAKILLDAGVSLARRFYLAPHPLEYIALKRARSKIRKFAEKSDIITVTHYHFDHYSPAWQELDAKWTWSSYKESKLIYGGKLVLAKDYRNQINYSQRKRGYLFWKIAGEFARIRPADSTSHLIQGTRLTFSPPLPHGEDNSELGFVLCVTIADGDDKVIFCPDIQGPISDATLRYIKEQECDYVILGGPPNYLAGMVAEELIERGFRNLENLLDEDVTLIVDHHCLRDMGGYEKIRSMKKTAIKRDSKLCTFAEYLHRGNQLLEARRRELYEEHPPSQEFTKWAKTTRLQSSLPPLQ